MRPSSRTTRATSRPMRKPPSIWRKQPGFDPSTRALLRPQGQFLGDGRDRAPAGRAPRSITTAGLSTATSRRNRSTCAGSTAIAPASSSCGTWCSSNTTGSAPTRSSRCPPRTSTPAWASSASSRCCRTSNSNYKTDLFTKSLDVLRSLTGHTEKEMLADFTPYRVIADHARSAAFLIADGVVPGNVGRNYVCRMIIRRAARFGTKIGLQRTVPGQGGRGRDRNLRGFLSRAGKEPRGDPGQFDARGDALRAHG